MLRLLAAAATVALPVLLANLVGDVAGVGPSVALGVILGFFGGLTAAIIPVGDNSWGLRQAAKVVVLGSLGGGLAGMYQADIATCTSTVLEHCRGLGRKGTYDYVSGLIALQGFQMLTAAGREGLARTLRAALSWTAKKDEGM